MVVYVNIKHIFQYPVEWVAETHLHKYPTEKEKLVQKIETIEKSKDVKNGIEYWKRVATCYNTIPSVLRKLAILNTEHVYLEEEAWLNRKLRQFQLKSRCLNFTTIANLSEESLFKPCDKNPSWTVLQQSGMINIHGLGPLGRLIETFARSLVSTGAKRGLSIMDDLLREKYGEPLGQSDLQGG